MFADLALIRQVLEIAKCRDIVGTLSVSGQEWDKSQKVGTVPPESGQLATMGSPE